MGIWLTRKAKQLDQLVTRIGVFFSWVSLILMLIIVGQIALTYLFKSHLVELEELQWHLYGVLIMVGLSYAQVTGSHVRVDLFHHRFSKRKQAIVDILGNLFLLIPFIYVVIYHSWDFVADSFIRMEHSPAPEGLPFRWIIKSFIPIGFTLLLLTTMARFFQDISRLIESHGNK